MLEKAAVSSNAHSLIHGVTHVARAISSRVSLDDVLRAVVDQAKTVGDTAKAVLCLFPRDARDCSVDARTIMVRGSRSEYDESWWLARIRQAAPTVAATGSPMATLDDEAQAWLLCVPVRADEKTIGLLLAINPIERPFADETVALLGILGAFAGTAVDGARLSAEANHQVLAQERRRIAKEMHDGLAQELFTIILALQVARKRVGVDHAEASRDRLAAAEQAVLDTLSELRQYIYDLRPMVLDKLGLAAAIRAQMDQLFGEGGPESRLLVEGPERAVPPAAETCVYRVAQELTTNVAKHSSAESVDVKLIYGPGYLELLVVDDGRGFDVSRAMWRAEHGESMGLRSVRERLGAEEGGADIESAPGQGTAVRAWLPYERAVDRS
jgi:signal transduction histidine kinase